MSNIKKCKVCQSEIDTKRDNYCERIGDKSPGYYCLKCAEDILNRPYHGKVPIGSQEHISTLLSFIPFINGKHINDYTSIWMMLVGVLTDWNIQRRKFEELIAAIRETKKLKETTETKQEEKAVS